MKERPILFSGEMVRAILDGRKTQTRRIILHRHAFQTFPEKQTADEIRERRGMRLMLDDASPDRAACLEYLVKRCPYGAPGDRLWVRETVGFVRDGDHDREALMKGKGAPKAADGWSPRYRADGLPPNTVETGFPWWPGIHMPRWASRLTLDVTAVRVERLQSITEEDARAEGFPIPHGVPGRIRVKTPDGKVTQSRGVIHDFTARGGFCHVWDGLNEKRAPWSSNPWVWVVTFTRGGAS